MTEDSPDIQVFNETSNALPVDQPAVEQIAATIADGENCTFSFVEVVFVDEEEIVRVNQQHLERDYITDIISFRYDESEDNTAIEGTLFCCAPRIIEQAKEFGQPAATEFRRIIIHGLLHLTGYDDKLKDQKREMTQQEDFYLSQINQ